MLERPLTKAGWARVRFDQIATQINDRVDNPAEAGVERYVGLEHLDPESLRIRRWGEPTDVESTKLRFQPGDIIFGKRRVYQRKVAVADFEGICSAHAMVLRAKPGAVLSEFLPFFMQSDLFMQRALSISVGSLSPTINWKALAAEEFLLPPIQEQARLVEISQATNLAIEALLVLHRSSRLVADAILQGPISEIRSLGRKDGWKVEKLGEIAEVTKLAGFEYTKHFDYGKGGEVIAIRPMNIKNGKLVLDDVQTIDQYTSDKLPRSKVNSGDVLITYIGAYVGEVLHIEESNRFHLAPNIARIRANSSLNTRLLERLLRSGFVQEQIQSYITATAAPSLTMENIRKLSIAFPISLLDQKSLLAILQAQDAVNAQASARIEELRTIQSLSMERLELP